MWDLEVQPRRALQPAESSPLLAPTACLSWLVACHLQWRKSERADVRASAIGENPSLC